MFRRRLRVALTGIKKYKGDDEEIIKQILEDCWNKNDEYYMVSGGHFTEFYCRDFGMIVKALIDLGHKTRVRKTLDYALSHFEKHGHITTTISPSGRCFNFPDTYAPDSLGFILNSLRILGDKALVQKYKKFLNDEIRYFVKEAIDPATGLIRKDKHFSTMKDYAIRESTCYDNCMAYLVQKNAAKLNLIPLLKKYDYKKLIMTHHWANGYFLDDLSGRIYIAGDAQTLPFWTGLIDDREMFKEVVKRVESDRLCHPFPMKYKSHKNSEHDSVEVAVFNKDYETTTVWIHLGIMWMEVLYKYDRAQLREEIKKYQNNINKHKNFLEVYEPDGSLFKTPFYITDESMSWSAVYLNLKTKLKKLYKDIE